MDEGAGPVEIDRLIGRLAGDARQRAGLSQADAASALGVRQSLVAKIEAGQRRLLLSEAFRLAGIYGCDLDAFNPAVTEALPRSGVRRTRVPTRKGDT